MAVKPEKNATGGKVPKYRNQKCTIDGIKFDSLKEGTRYRQLQVFVKSGVIANLRLQVPFELAPAVTIHGKKKRALTYIADFCYTEQEQEVIEDVKGFITAVYKIKRHLMKSVLGLSVIEI